MLDVYWALHEDVQFIQVLFWATHGDGQFVHVCIGEGVLALVFMQYIPGRSLSSRSIEFLFYLCASVFSLVVNYCMYS